MDISALVPKKTIWRPATTEEFLENFAGILTAFIQSVKDEEFNSSSNEPLRSRTKKEFYSSELKDLIDVLQTICSRRPEYRAYFIEQAVPRMCIGKNITKGDEYLIKVISELLTWPQLSDEE